MIHNGLGKRGGEGDILRMNISTVDAILPSDFSQFQQFIKIHTYTNTNQTHSALTH
jgi:hypothetical protein